MSVHFKIVVPTYNTEGWIARCLYSIHTQVHKDWQCIVYNDASTDSTKEVIDSLDFVKNDSRFSVIHNEQNVKALQNIVDGFNLLNAKKDPESVLMIIDGDDFLFSEYSLAIVEQAYEQTGCVLTYGNHIHHPTGGKSNCEPIPIDVIQNKQFRNYKFVASHLRTFKSKLWYSIKDEDLRDDDGKYFSVGWDVSFMLPMLEMAGTKFVHIPNVLYCYNRFNPLSDDVIRQIDQHRVEMKIRNMPKYETIY